MRFVRSKVPTGFAWSWWTPGRGPLEIVCGAMNFEVGNYVPLAPVGRGSARWFRDCRTHDAWRDLSRHALSSRELRLSDDHQGSDDSRRSHRAARSANDSSTRSAISPDVIFDISVEGNRPDAWSVEGVARDLAARLGRPLHEPTLATPNAARASDSFATAGIEDPELCGRLTLSVLRKVRVAPSPPWVAQRLQLSGMRPISNVVDASNFVMLELGQPTHPYDASKVAGHTLRARRARHRRNADDPGRRERELATAGRGLGDTGVDGVIVDGEDQVLGLAGIMGGASSESMTRQRRVARGRIL